MRRRGTALLLCMLMMFLICACGAGGSGAGETGDTEQQTAAAAQEDGFDLTPHTKPDGSKYQLAFMDYDEYLPSSRLFFYILKGLEEMGWIRRGSIPFTAAEIEENSIWVDQMYEKLLEADLGEYVEFSRNGFFYQAYTDEEEIKKTLTEHAGRGIDLILASGTDAGLFVKDLGLDIPLLDFSATDPVSSGIIDSATEGTGSPLIWAQVEPSLPLRQLRYYYSLKPFQKLGTIIYKDEIISGVPDIEASSREIGFELVKYFIQAQQRETEEELDAYYDLVLSKIREIIAEGIDAFFLPVDLINDIDRLPQLLEPFYEKNIPVYLMDDVAAVHAGVLMLISASGFLDGFATPLVTDKFMSLKVVSESVDESTALIFSVVLSSILLTVAPMIAELMVLPGNGIFSPMMIGAIVYLAAAMLLLFFGRETRRSKENENA